MNEEEKILIGIFSFVLTIAIMVSVSFLVFNEVKDKINYQNKTLEEQCHDICISNNLQYREIQERGYAGTEIVCYCISNLGEITTRMI